MHLHTGLHYFPQVLKSRELKTLLSKIVVRLEAYDRDSSCISLDEDQFEQLISTVRNAVIGQ